MAETKQRVTDPARPTGRPAATTLGSTHPPKPTGARPVGGCCACVHTDLPRRARVGHGQLERELPERQGAGPPRLAGSSRDLCEFLRAGQLVPPAVHERRRSADVYYSGPAGGIGESVTQADNKPSPTGHLPAIVGTFLTERYSVDLGHPVQAPQRRRGLAVPVPPGERDERDRYPRLGKRYAVGGVAHSGTGDGHRQTRRCRPSPLLLSAQAVQYAVASDSNDRPRRLPLG